MSPRVTVAHEGAPPCPLPFATDSCPRNVVEALIEHDWSSEAFKPIQLLATSKVSQIFRALVLKSPNNRWRRDRVLGKIQESEFPGGDCDEDCEPYSPEVVVLKVYEKKRMRDIHHRNVRREITIHKEHASCVHVIPLFAAFEDRSCYYLVQKEETFGDLYRELRKGMIQALTLSEQYDFDSKSNGHHRTLNCLYGNERRCAAEVIKPLLCLLQHLHSQGVIHRDIKPENVLLSSWKREDQKNLDASETIEGMLCKGLWDERDPAASVALGGSDKAKSNGPHSAGGAQQKLRGCSAALKSLGLPLSGCVPGGASSKKQKRYDKHLKMRSRKGWKIQLCDFGLAIDTKVTTPLIRVGTVDYMAPEVLRCPSELDLRELQKVEKLRSALIKGGKTVLPDNLGALGSAPTKMQGQEAPGKRQQVRYDHRVDIWAVGVLLYELLVGCPPFGSQLDSEDKTEHRILEGSISFPKGVVSPLAKSFILKALTYTWTERPSALELLRHPWITKYCGELETIESRASTKGKQPFGRLNSKHLDTLLWKVI